MDEPHRCEAVVSLSHWHAHVLLLTLTLAGDVLCIALAAFGDMTRRYAMPHLFWWVLWLAQVPLGVQAILGVGLMVSGAWPRTPYHLMYGALILLTVLALYGLRPGGWIRRTFIRDERTYRESRWLLALCLFLAGLVGRAYMTGVLGR
jgi:heme A synthase